MTAQVNETEIISSGGVSNTSGLIAAFVIPNAVRGPVMTPILLSDPNKLLQVFSMDNTIKPGSSLAYYGLSRWLETGTAWAVRPFNTGLFNSAIEITSTGSATTTNAPAPVPQYPNALTTYTFGVTGCILLASKDPGSWGNRLSVAISLPSSTSILFNYQFNITVYLDSAIVETWSVTRVIGTLDGYGQSAYILDVLKASLYLGADDNVAVVNTVLPSVIPMTALINGADGTTATSANIITALDLYYQKNNYSLTILLDIGIDTVPVQEEMSLIASTRKDCAAITATPFSVENDIINYTANIVAYRTTFVVNDKRTGIWCNHLEMFDKYNNRNIYISATLGAALAINNVFVNANPWQPAAGWIYGVLVGFEDTLLKLETGDLALITAAGINPIRKTNRGIVVWGQKNTTYPPNLADRMNVTFLLITIIPVINNFLESDLFKLDTTTVQTNVVTVVSAYLAGIKGKGGLYAFRVVCDSTNNTPANIDNYQFNVDIYLQPAKGIEEIQERLIVTPTGATLQ